MKILKLLVAIVAIAGIVYYAFGMSMLLWFGAGFVVGSVICLVKRGR